MFKIKILKKLNNYLVLVLIVLILMGCSDSTYTPPGSSGTTNNPRIEIVDIYPTYTTGSYNTNFKVTSKLYDVSGASYNTTLTIRNHSTGCDAWSKDTTITGSGYTTVTKVYTDSLSSLCVEPNSILRVAIKAVIEGIIKTDSCYYQWGNPTLTNCSTLTIERYKMPYVNNSYCDTAVKCIIRSFNPPDSNYIKDTLNFDNLHYILNDTVFSPGGIGQKIVMLDNYSNYIVSLYGNHGIKNRIIFSHSQDLIDNEVGWSHTGQDNYRNYSYIWKKTIDDNSSSYDKYSITNQVSVHEQIHQIGIVFDSIQHFLHTGYFANRCALHFSDANTFYYDWKKYTGLYRICTHHAIRIRTTLNCIPEPSGITNLNPIIDNKLLNLILPIQRQNFLFNKYSVIMSLLKQSYKEYEPVIAKFELINHDSIAMPIYELFIPYLYETGVLIKDENGNTYSHNNALTNISIDVLRDTSKPMTKLNPGDTLIISMPLNNWGLDAGFWKDQNSKDFYFDQFGYFPLGKYKASFYLSYDGKMTYGVSLGSNEVEFEVTALNDEDIEILKNLKNNFWSKQQNDFDDIIYNYPNNVFVEHIMAEKLTWFGGAKTNEIKEKDYIEFMNKFPNSYYFLNWRFFAPFLKILIDKKDGLTNAINYILGTTNSNVLLKALSNKALLGYWEKVNN
jgi:hypothetical protein